MSSVLCDFNQFYHEGVKIMIETRIDERNDLNHYVSYSSKKHSFGDPIGYYIDQDEVCKKAEWAARRWLWDEVNDIERERRRVR